MAARNIRARSRSDGPEGWELNAMSRKYQPGRAGSTSGSQRTLAAGTSDELHAWSIYRQNLNSEFTDSALGSSDKSPLPYGNFQLRETTVNSILQNPKYGARSELGSNMYTYLKYGLPRVFPPGGRRDGSSGYDSSDDGSPSMAARDRYRRAKSNPELRGGSAAPRTTRAFGDSVFRSKKHRSSSEANLLAGESTLLYQRDGAGQRCADDAYSELGAQSVYTHRVERRRPASVARSRAGSRISAGSRMSRAAAIGSAAFSRRHDAGVAGGAAAYGRDPPMLNDKLFPKDQALDSKHPHLQVRNLSCERRETGGWRRLLDGVNFEAHGGELVGVMAATEREGTAILDILSDRGNSWRLRMRGDLVLNGCTVVPSRLASRVAYVQQDCSFTDTMTVRQTLLFSAFLQEPGHVARGFNVKQKINALIDDLGLGQVKHSRLSDLTGSERRRLNVACHLCLDTDLLLLDQPTKQMDIFDTFFLVEYLRQWAGRGRIVVLTLHPPTYEIFTMLSKVVLLSSQRVIYSGKRREMLPYFAFIDYPCPAYKNPSDYYLDLVTLDDLSPEATLESSQRVDELAEMFRRRQEALTEPGPPGLLPPKIRRANFCLQILALWIRALVYKFPHNLLRWGRTMVLACLMSLIIGIVFYDQRGDNNDQENVPDRLGFHYAMLSLAAWPLLMFTITDVWLEKDSISRDVGDRLYSKFAFIASKMFYSLPGSVLESLILVIPAFKLAGDQPRVSDNAFYIYVGYMVLYVLAVRMLASAAGWVSSSRHLAAGWLSALLVPLLTVAGWSAHPQDLSLWTGWLRWLSAPAWLLERLSWAELAPVHSFRCDRNPVIPQDNTIIVQVDCGVLTGVQALRFSGLGFQLTPLLPLLITAATALLGLLAGLIAFIVCRQKRARSRGRLNKQM